MFEGQLSEVRNYNADGTLGQRNTAGSIAVVISTEQENILSGILTNSGFNTKIDLVAKETTLLTLLTQTDFDTKIGLVATQATLATRLSETALTQRVGEVVDVPADYTLLKRLKDITTQLTTKVLGLFDGAGVAIGSAVNFGVNRLEVLVLSKVAKFTDDAKMFGSIIEDVNLPTAGVYTPIFLLDNPVTSGKTVLLYVVIYDIDTAGRSGKFELWANPTVSANGTALPKINQKIGSAVASVVNTYSSPTVSAGTGNLLEVVGNGKDVNSVIREYEFSIQIPAGNKIVIKGNPSANATLATVAVDWVEA